MLLTISGKMGSGKSTISNELVKRNNFEIISVGSEIKPLANLLINERSLFIKKAKQVLPKNKGTIQAINKVLHYFDENFTNGVWKEDGEGGYVKNKDYRLLLQDFPMIIRELFGDEVFARLLLSKVSGGKQGTRMVCDDIRLLKEKRLLEDNGSIMIRFDIDSSVQKERLLKTYGTIDESTLQHPTETALDDAVFDLHIDVTYKSVEEITNEVQMFLCSYEAKAFKHLVI